MIRLLSTSFVWIGGSTEWSYHAGSWAGDLLVLSWNSPLASNVCSFRFHWKRLYLFGELCIVQFQDLVILPSLWRTNCNFYNKFYIFIFIHWPEPWSPLAPLYQGEPGKHGDKSAGRIGTFELGEWLWICASWLSGTLIEIGIHGHTKSGE